MIVISGLRRSGTSMLMYALKEAGFKIAGEKFNGNRIKENPNGYWEIPDICKDKGLYKIVDGEVVKVMFEALSFSNPALIEKAVFIFRQPKKALYSMFKSNTIDYKDIFILKHAIDTIDAFNFAIRNNIPHKLVFYEDIIKNPKEEMKGICDFLGKGDSEKASGVIDKKLNRSKNCEENDNIKYLEDIYKYAKICRVDKIIKMLRKIEEQAKIAFEEYDKQKK